MSDDRVEAERLIEAVREAAYWVGYDSASRRYDPARRAQQDEAVQAAIRAMTGEPQSPKPIPEGELPFGITDWRSWIDHEDIRKSGRDPRP